MALWFPDSMTTEFLRLKDEELKMAARQTAIEFVQDLVPESIHRLSSAGLLDAKVSVATDTLEMNQELKQMRAFENGK